MDGKISLVWAVEVDYPQLGARLEAYVDTKAQITTLKACVAHPEARPVSKLLVELVSMVGDALKDIVYTQKIPEWHQGARCVQNECVGRDHFKTSELSTRFEDDVIPDTEDFEESLERHMGIDDEHLHKITPTAPSKNGGTRSKFMKCKKVSLTSTWCVPSLFKTDCYSI